MRCRTYYATRVYTAIAIMGKIAVKWVAVKTVCIVAFIFVVIATEVNKNDQAWMDQTTIGALQNQTAVELTCHQIAIRKDKCHC